MKNTLLGILLVVGANVVFAHNDVTFKFTENKGQFNSKVLYHNKLHIGDMFLEKDRFTFNLFDPDQLDEFYRKKHGINAVDENGANVSGANGIPEISDRSAFDVEEIDWRMHAYSMIFENASSSAIVTSEDVLPGHYNYMIGNDRNKWAAGVKSYRLVKYDEIYPGIDLEIYAAFKNMKYDFIVAPGSDPNQISINYEGVDDIRIMNNGYLLVTLSNGEVKEMNPTSYQSIDGERVDVPCDFQLNGTVLTFDFPEGYDITKELTIDPTWIFSTLSGSTADNWGFTATYDSQGNVYAAGVAFGSGYPTTPGAYSTSSIDVTGLMDIAIHKYNPAGTSLLYGTYLGGAIDDEMPHSLVCDQNDELVLMGTSSSPDYPVTAGVFDDTFNGGTAAYANMWGVVFGAGCDIVLTRLNASGAVVNSTFVGGTDNDGLNQSMVYNYSDQCRGEVVLDESGNIYVATSVWSDDFPVTDGSGINGTGVATAQDAVVFRMTPTLSGLDWGTYLGGSDFEAGYSLRISNTGTVFVTGGTTSTSLGAGAGTINPSYSGNWDGFIASFNGTTGAHIEKTYLGTSEYDQGFILEIDEDGDVYVTGQTLGAYPVVSAIYSEAYSAQFIHKLSSDLTTTIYSTIFGSGSLSGPPPTQLVDISLTAFLVDNCENVYVSGWGGGLNSSSNGLAYDPQAGGSTSGLGVSADAQQGTTDGADFYFFVLEQDADARLYATFLGDNGTSEHTDGGTSRFDPAGVVYQSVCAACVSGDFPTTPGVYSSANTGGLCNMGAIKFEFDFQGVVNNATSPGDQTLCGSPYNVDFTGGSSPQHEWDFGDGNTSTAANPTHTYADSGTYQVMYVAIDPALTCGPRDTVYFDINLIIPETFSAVINVPPYDPCTAPDSLLVELEFTGSGADSLSWNMGDGTVYSDSLNIAHYYMTEGTYYIEMIAYDFICNLTDTIRDTVRYVSGYTAVNATAPPDQFFCSGPFVVDFTGDTVPDHFWDFGDATGTSTSQNPTYTYADTGTYTVMYVAIDSSTCNIADTAYFTVQLDQAETFSATVNVPPIDPCNAPDSLLVDLTFTGTSADSLYWDMGDGTTYINDTVIAHYYDTMGTYYIEMIAWDLVCNFTDTIRDTVNYFADFTTVTATAPPDQMICSAPFDVTFTGDATPNHFWDFGDGTGTSTLQNPMYTYADSGVYTVMYVAIDSSTCNIADTVYFTITLNLEPELTAVFDLPTVDPCTSPDSLEVNLTFTGPPGAADSLFWDLGDGTTYIDSTSLSHFYTSQGVYVITMEAWDFTCGTYATITDTVDFTLSFSYAVADASPNILACDPPFDVTFDGGTPPPPMSFWDFDDGTTSTLTNPTHTFLDTGHYDILYVAIDSSTCNIADSVWLTVDILEAEQFSATLDFDPPPPCGSDSIVVNLAFTGTGADSLAWDFGDGTIIENDTIVSHVYYTPGVYTISLYAEDTLCDKTETVNNVLYFYGNPNSEVIVPNVFTPNQDGKNDYILFSGVDPNAEFTWTIFNRWGKPIFETVRRGQAWDGTNMFNAKPLEAGLYYYELIFRDQCTDEDKIITGFIHLMR